MKSTAPSSLLLLPLHLAALVRAGYNWDIIHHGIVPSFRWQMPFTTTGEPLMGFNAICQEFGTFTGTQYKHSDLSLPPPKGLRPYADAVDALFTSRAYPGGWDGVDLRGENRDVVVVEYKDVPEKARAWIEAQLADEKMRLKRFFGLYEKVDDPDARVDPAKDVSDLPVEKKVLIAAPGELYDFLPLWIAAGSECEDKFLDLSIYAFQAKDKSTVAWVIQHGEPDRENEQRNITFKIEGQYLHELEENKHVRQFWERVHRSAAREERKRTREERAKAKATAHDEL